MGKQRVYVSVSDNEPQSRKYKFEQCRRIGDLAGGAGFKAKAGQTDEKIEKTGRLTMTFDTKNQALNYIRSVEDRVEGANAALAPTTRRKST